MRSRLGGRLALFVIVAGVSLAGQASFEVASIRRSPASPTPGGSSSRMQPGGSYAATNMTLQQLIAAAYGIPTTRVFDGPGWASTDRYDIVAKAAGNPTTAETARLLQILLRERFSLAARVEQRELPVYALVMARADGRIGPRLWRSAAECPKRAPVSTSDLTARPVCGIPLLVSKGVSFFLAGDVPMSTVAQALTGAAGRPVLDHTGLTGRYDISVDWASSPDVDSISVFTAVQEQLGLKLESTTAPLDVVVIERVERPSEN